MSWNVVRFVCGDYVPYVCCAQIWLEVVCPIRDVLSLPQEDMVLIKLDMSIRRIRVAQRLRGMAGLFLIPVGETMNGGKSKAGSHVRDGEVLVLE